MAKLTFIDGDITTGAAYAMNANTAFNGGTVGNIGMWCVEAGSTGVSGDHLNGTGLEIFLGQAGSITSSTISPSKFQITQQTAAGYPYASGIIEKERVRRVTHTTYLVDAKATTGAVTITSAGVNNSEFRLTIVKLSGYSDYAEFLSPTGSYDDRAGQVRSYTYQSDAVQTAVELADGMAAAINADLGAFVTCTHTVGSAALTIVAKDNGTGFRIIDNSATAIAPTSLVGTFGYNEGTGNGHQAIEAEKKSLHHRGAYHNRLWLPQTGPETFAAAAGTYDIYTIECDNGVRGDATNAKDQLILELWIDSNCTATGVMDDFWQPINYSAAAGVTTVLYTAS